MCCEIQFNPVQLLVSFRDFDLGCPSLCAVNPTRHQQQTGNQWGAPASHGFIPAGNSEELQLCGALDVLKLCQGKTATPPVQFVCAAIFTVQLIILLFSRLFLLISEKSSSAPSQPALSCSAVWALPLWLLGTDVGLATEKNSFLIKITASVTAKPQQLAGK